jgi:hypothetical protein
MIVTTNNFAVIQFYPCTTLNTSNTHKNHKAFDIHVVNEEVGLEDEEEKQAVGLGEIKTTLHQRQQRYSNENSSAEKTII